MGHYLKKLAFIGFVSVKIKIDPQAAEIIRQVKIAGI